MLVVLVCIYFVIELGVNVVLLGGDMHLLSVFCSCASSKVNLEDSLQLLLAITFVRVVGKAGEWAGVGHGMTSGEVGTDGILDRF